MTPQEWHALEALHDRQEDFFHAETDDTFKITSVLDGSKVINLSHGGGELHDLVRDLFMDVKNIGNEGLQKCHMDYRTCWDRAQCRTDVFASEMPENTRTSTDLNDGQLQLYMLGIFCTEKHALHIGTDLASSVSSGLVCQGVVPCAPLRPHTAVTMDTLEFYHVACNRSPHLSIQAFVKTISDLQGIQYWPYLARLFSITLDVYLQMHLVVNELVLKALHHDTPDWRLKNACPACTYTLEDEPNLKFKLLFAMDGNDLLKHISRAAIGSYESTEKDVEEWFIGDDHYLSQTFVNQFGVGCSDKSLMEPMADNNNPCAGRWKNMKEDVTSRMWGIFNEAGIFMAVCRHGFSLVVTDIVQSGEQAKYLLAAVSKLWDAFGEDLAGGYDIGCKFGMTLNHSTVRPRAQALNYTSLVPAFHGYAHCRLCQLRFLARYVDGMGLEDLEGCECMFSKTNGLASAVHYASAFHRHQAIAGYIAHNDKHKVYQNLTTMILNNYRQALHIAQEGKNTLPRLMDDLGIMDVSVFRMWLLEENEYLITCSPEEEMLQMEYWQKLVNLDASWKHLSDLAWTVATPSSTGTSSFVQMDIAATMQKETMRHHATENFEKDLKVVQDLEVKLGITKHWVPEDEEWQTAGCLVANCKYQCCLDQLESLIVAWIFELPKMNQAGTGYKLCKHIAKALKARSATIHTALDWFNTAAHACSPPRRQLMFEEVVEYMFLADFDLLRNATCEDISQRPWASPAVHAAMDHYFKVCRVEEEIEHLNVEIHRMVTYLHEDRYMTACIAQLQLYHSIRARFTNRHLCLLTEMAGLHGFTGTTFPGNSMKTNPGDSAGEPVTIIPLAISIATTPTFTLAASDSGDDNSDLDEFDADKDEYEDDRSTLTLQEIICISSDRCGVQE
ncbi:hypothetical protein EDC04DRAFT_2939417 [Pisolithus marmoratus]|nr:hypothetical protein EDC04DRAFT_2939417 [Pisolithus marmoratus]